MLTSLSRKCHILSCLRVTFNPITFPFCKPKSAIAFFARVGTAFWPVIVSKSFA
jgi:hypothetical protein